MERIKKLVRANILSMEPYSSARHESDLKNAIFLDANENPYGSLNRYPDPFQKELKKCVQEIKNVSIDQICIGNGSDEIIDLLMRVFCKPGTDKIAIFQPTYGMYEVAAAVNDVDLVKLDLTNYVNIPTTQLSRLYNDSKIKVLFICSPNNPTGTIFPKEEIETILGQFNGIVVVDEAYVDFSESSLLDLINSYDNLVVCQTLSKAWGLAGARIGMAFSNPFLISLLNKIKPPYNISTINQNAAIKALQSIDKFNSNKENILIEKNRLTNQINDLDIVKKIYPSDANFLLIEFKEATKLFSYLKAHCIVVRNRSNVIPNCLRISIGTKNENKKLIQTLKAYDEENTIYR